MLLHSLKKQPYTDLMFLKSFILMRMNTLVTLGAEWGRRQWTRQTKQWRVFRWFSPCEQGFTLAEGLMPIWSLYQMPISTLHTPAVGLMCPTAKIFIATSSGCNKLSASPWLISKAKSKALRGANSLTKVQVWFSSVIAAHSFFLPLNIF